ncbi:hypothetical protein CFIMG_007360RA00001 [Ceratocystis fimbriata CBS 114723]|uniref:LYC1 C-terminal domain-containing protein n=1 Tax=Ceratocystis fimbriata CBS 114723 TaxID=1035309 RepID=A0A2C5XHD1_9PEZI|nr:hypothetical protein CFIMG_007360RA00001 [Ceratocystis fimbriata CBS 114723]
MTMTGDSNATDFSGFETMTTDSAELPAASSPDVIISHPTPDECSHVYTLTSADWGAALPTRADYIRREKFLTHLPLSQRGSARQWILTTTGTPGTRPILSSCDTLRRRGLVAMDGTVDEVEVQAIGAVFTDPAFRGRRYAQRLMQLLQQEMEAPASDTGHVTPGLSVLFSDIGKTFYAKLGWNVHESRHVEIRPSITGLSGAAEGESQKAQPLRMHDLAELCVLDEAVLRKAMAKSTETAIALIPDYDTMLWHHLREDFMTTTLFEKSPAVRGAISGPVGARVWAVWVRSYYSGASDPKDNTMHILRLGFEDQESMSDSELAERLTGILDIAVKEAHEWVTSSVHMWNPPEQVIGALEKTGIEFSMVDREETSIPSVMMHGKFHGKTANKWIINEKFGWY